MKEVELRKPLKLSDLEIGKIFEKSELIFDRDETFMRTVCWQKGVTDGKIEYDMIIFGYDITSIDGKVIAINNNGLCEIYKKDLDYQRFSDELNRAGLRPLN